MAQFRLQEITVSGQRGRNMIDAKLEWEIDTSF